MKYTVVLSLCLVALVSDGMCQSNNSTDIKNDIDVFANATIETTVMPLYNCQDGLNKCHDSFSSTKENRQDTKAYINCINSVRCDGSEADKKLKSDELNRVDANYMHFTKIDDKENSASLSFCVNVFVVTAAFISTVSFL
ncbi:hypothetical protein Btru_037648 [Bulinus truncatus]|nr:hypothetical protein Btru_037648 [Bulinus truncatus]